MAETAETKLARYRAMRDFGQTAEPSGAHAQAHAEPSFVVQLHHASHVHYDFRLELDGVLLSWSVPKGPCLAPATRRLAMRTEDHPLDYARFEGIIPKGQYGGGTVAVWDHGTWIPEDGLDGARKGLASGRLAFALQGERLHGKWHLVRTRPQGSKEAWLLFKSRDEAASDTRDIVGELPTSVISGRTIDEIAADPAKVWQSNRAEKTQTEDETDGKVGHARAPARPATSSRPATSPRPSRPATSSRPARPATSSRPARSARPSRPSGARAAKGEAPAQVPARAQLIEQLAEKFALSSVDKILDPATGLTKGELAAYYAVVADWMLPHIVGRPLTAVRCPTGTAHHCFFQKQLLPGSPPAIKPLALTENGGEPATYMQIHDLAGLLALAQIATMEIHTWGAHADKLERPDLVVLDIDPDPTVGWDRVALAAFELRKRLAALDLESFVKTTGGKGLHVVVPIDRCHGWDEVEGFARGLCEQLERAEPSGFTTNMGKAHRKNKIFLDYLRNGRGATFVAPYSPRKRPGVPVAVPITWEELAAGVEPLAFDIATVPRRLGGLAADPWGGLGGTGQKLTAAALASATVR